MALRWYLLFTCIRATGDWNTVIFFSIGEKLTPERILLVIARKSYEAFNYVKQQNNIIFGNIKTSGEDTGVTYYFIKIATTTEF